MSLDHALGARCLHQVGFELQQDISRQPRKVRLVTSAFLPFGLITALLSREVENEQLWKEIDA